MLDDAEDSFYGRDKTGNELPGDIKDQTKRLKKIKQALSNAQETGKEKINLTDHDANFMKDKQIIQTNYNCHLAVDNKTKLILSNEVITSPADTLALKTQVKTIEETFKDKPKELLADSGYCSVDNPCYLEDKQIKGYMPHQDDARNIKDIFKDKENLFDEKFFKYNRLKDQYTCPQGKTLPKKATQYKRGLTLYKAKDCPQCGKQKLCLRGKAK